MFFIRITRSIFLSVNAQNIDNYQHQNSLQTLLNPPQNSQNSYTWLGGDVATSIALNHEKYVWIFGDTLLGTVTQQSRNVTTMTHNSIGTTQCRNSVCQPIKKLNKLSHSHPVASISLDDIHQYYWPTSGKMLNKKLFLTGYRLKDSDNMKIIGTTFALVSNPFSIPRDWKYKTYNIFHADANFNWATATTIHDKWLYIFGEVINTKKDKVTVLSRILILDAEMGYWSHIQYWQSDSRWVEHITSSDVLTPIKGLPGTSEMSLEHNNYFGWYTLQIPFLSFNVHLYTAAKLTGPWVDKGVIYTIPQPWDLVKKAKANQDFFSYAPKLHPELATCPNEIIFTYNINQFNFQNFLQNIKNKDYLWLYIPQFMTVKVNT